MATYKTFSAGDADFCFIDNITVVPRAGVEISPECSDYVKQMLVEAFNRGWIKCVAHVPDVEYTWEKLQS